MKLSNDFKSTKKTITIDKVHIDELNRKIKKEIETNDSKRNSPSSIATTKIICKSNLYAQEKNENGLIL